MNGHSFKERKEMRNKQNWSAEDQIFFSDYLLMSFIGQNILTNKEEHRLRCSFWVKKLGCLYDVGSVVHAIDIYTDSNSDMPTPYLIISFLKSEDCIF